MLLYAHVLDSPDDAVGSLIRIQTTSIQHRRSNSQLLQRLVSLDKEITDCMAKLIDPNKNSYFGLFPSFRRQVLVPILDKTRGEFISSQVEETWMRWYDAGSTVAKQYFESCEKSGKEISQSFYRPFSDFLLTEDFLSCRCFILECLLVARLRQTHGWDIFGGTCVMEDMDPHGLDLLDVDLSIERRLCRIDWKIQSIDSPPFDFNCKIDWGKFTAHGKAYKPLIVLGRVLQREE